MPRDDGADIVNIGTGVRTTNEALVELAQRVTGVRVRPIAAGYPERPVDSATNVADISKARRLLGWAPAHSLERGASRDVAMDRRSRRRAAGCTKRPRRARDERAAGRQRRPPGLPQPGHARGAARAGWPALSSDRGGCFELLFVNDNCPDGSLDGAAALAGRDARVRVIALDVRGGQMAALRAGIAAARGRTVVTMDADLQDPPEAIPRLLAALDDGGFGAVYAGRRGRYESSRRLVSSWVFKHAISLVTGMPADAGSVRRHAA